MITNKQRLRLNYIQRISAYQYIYKGKLRIRIYICDDNVIYSWQIRHYANRKPLKPLKDLPKEESCQKGTYQPQKKRKKKHSAVISRSGLCFSFCKWPCGVGRGLSLSTITCDNSAGEVRRSLQALREEISSRMLILHQDVLVRTTLLYRMSPRMSLEGQ